MVFILIMLNWVFVFKHPINPIVQPVLLIKKNYLKIFVVDIERLVIYVLLIHLMIVIRILSFRFICISYFLLENDISKASWLTPKLNSAFREAFDKLLQSVSDQNTTLKNAPS